MKLGALLECLGKGICLVGLVVLALRQPSLTGSLTYAAVLILGMAVALIAAAVSAWRSGQRPRGQIVAFLLYLALENPTLVYLGLVGGSLTSGLVLWLVLEVWTGNDVLLVLGGGVLVGMLGWVLRQVPHRLARRGTVLLCAAAAATAAVFYLDGRPDLLSDTTQQLLSWHLLAAVPLLVLLNFAGRTEETELEIGAVALLLAVGMWFLLPPSTRLAAIVLPVAVYLLYTALVMRKLQAFKHVLRGMSHAQLRRPAPALEAYRRALQLDPGNTGAQAGLWRVHRQINLAEVARDPALLALIDFDLCLQRAKELLLSGAPPSPESLAEAQRLLALVLDQRPALRPAVLYWRAVGHAHARDLDKAADDLRLLLDESAFAPAENAARAAVLVEAWQLALVQHPGLQTRVGAPLLAAGKRLDAIAAVERRLAEQPEALDVRDLKIALYADLTETDYKATHGSEPAAAAADFDHAYCQHLGLKLLADPERWQRGCEFLRLALRGELANAPALWLEIARAAERFGDSDQAEQARGEVLRLGRELGPAQLTAAAQAAFYAVARQAGEAAYQAGAVDRAIDHLLLCLDDPKSGIDTVRMLAELYEKRGDVWGTLAFNERCLIYAPQEPTFLERKDRIYVSLTPADWERAPDRLKSQLDVAYCVRKARALLDHPGSGPDQLAWSRHLAELAITAHPQHVPALVLAGRAALRLGETAVGQARLEAARAVGRGQVAGDDLDAWYVANRLLGDLYMEQGQYADAVACFNDFKASAKSGADTLFKLARCHEHLGDAARAAKLYKNVASYDHPLAYEARQAWQRLATPEPTG